MLFLKNRTCWYKQCTNKHRSRCDSTMMWEYNAERVTESMFIGVDMKLGKQI